MQEERWWGMSKEAIEHYEAALKEAFPSGATGDVFHHWNEARKALAEQPAPGRAHYEDGDVFERIAAMKKQPAQQEPVAWIEHNDETSEPCPSCGKPLQSASGGGVVCSGRCGYWFCF